MQDKNYSWGTNAELLQVASIMELLVIIVGSIVFLMLNLELVPKMRKIFLGIMTLTSLIATIMLQVYASKNKESGSTWSMVFDWIALILLFLTNLSFGEADDEI